MTDAGRWDDLAAAVAQAISGDADDVFAALDDAQRRLHTLQDTPEALHQSLPAAAARVVAATTGPAPLRLDTDEATTDRLAVLLHATGRILSALLTGERDLGGTDADNARVFTCLATGIPDTALDGIDARLWPVIEQHTLDTAFAVRDFGQAFTAARAQWGEACQDLTAAQDRVDTGCLPVHAMVAARVRIDRADCWLPAVVVDASADRYRLRHVAAALPRAPQPHDPAPLNDPWTRPLLTAAQWQHVADRDTFTRSVHSHDLIPLAGPGLVDQILPA